MEFKDNIPIYLQIEQYLYREIAMGQKSNTLIITNLVVMWKMNNQGILYTKRGEGNFVTEDTELLAQTKKTLIDDELESFVQNMTRLGLKENELISALEDYLRGRDK